MTFMADPIFQERLIEALNGDENFRTQTTAFDGSILLEAGADRLWLKIYRGQVIDSETAVPVFGYTFKLSGPETAWEQFVAGERVWADMVFPGARHFDDDPKLETLGQMTAAITTEGNLLEAGRLTEATFLLAYTLQRVAR